MLLGNIFLNGAPYFFSVRGAAFYPTPPRKSLEPRPKFACRSKILQNQIFIFVAGPYYNRSGIALTSPLPSAPTKKRSSLLTTPKL